MPNVILADVALSVRQPWASLIISGGKNIENREWPTKRRGLEIELIQQESGL